MAFEGEGDDGSTTDELLRQLRQLAEQDTVVLEGTRFQIRKLPAMQAHRVWREMLHELGKSDLLEAFAQIQTTDLATNRAGALAFVRGVFSLPVDYLERLQRQIFTYVSFSNRRATSVQGVAGAEDTAFDGLDPLHIEELLLRGLAVNFMPSLLRIGSKLMALAPSTTSSSPSEIAPMFVPLIANGIASPVDLRTTWTLDDAFDGLEALAVDSENQRRAYDAAKKAGR